MSDLVLRPLAHAPPRRLAYQAQDYPRTLAEGLAEYYAVNAGRVMRPETLTDASAELFRRHDICHVIFGLDTTLADEALADTRTVLSTDVGARAYVGYLNTSPEARALFRELGWRQAAWVTLLSLPRMGRAAFEAMRMRRRWPWAAPPALLDRPIGALRAEYGIRVV